MISFCWYLIWYLLSILLYGILLLGLLNQYAFRERVSEPRFKWCHMIANATVKIFNEKFCRYLTHFLYKMKKMSTFWTVPYFLLFTCKLITFYTEYEQLLSQVLIEKLLYLSWSPTLKLAKDDYIRPFKFRDHSYVKVLFRGNPFLLTKFWQFTCEKMALVDNWSTFFVEKSFHVSILMFKWLTADWQPLSLLQFAFHCCHAACGFHMALF